MTIRPIDLELFIENARNVHEAIVACSKRARQINDDIKIEFNQRIETIAVKPEATESEEVDVNPDQLRIAMEFEKRAKPTEVALDELAAQKLQWYYRETETPVVVEKEEESPEAEE
jgi:DNA-directed RNA polymerase subunit K/omega